VVAAAFCWGLNAVFAKAAFDRVVGQTIPRTAKVDGNTLGAPRGGSER
jgi:hypothetical protein